MPVHKVKGGYKWGSHGKTYPTKAGAERQARAVYASGWREESKGGPTDPESELDDKKDTK